jgi:hypothetical protein
VQYKQENKINVSEYKQKIQKKSIKELILTHIVECLYNNRGNRKRGAYSNKGD